MLTIKNKTYRELHAKPLAALCMLMLSACTADSVPSATGSDAQEQKTPIELTVGISGERPAFTRSAFTRTVVTADKPTNLAQPFANGTSIYMVMKSEKSTGGADPMYTRTIGFAQEVATTPANSTVVKFASQYGRFWEDSYSRNSQLSVYAACVPGYYLPGSVYDGVTPVGTVDGTTWTVGGSTTYSNMWADDLDATTIAWPLRGATTAAVANQTTAFLSSQDLCFSNNVSNIDDDPEDGLAPADNRVTFSESLKKFGSGRMVFYHALTWVTFKIKKGEGFNTNDPFLFSNAHENIVLKGFNTSGTFTLTTGEFTTVNESTPIYELAETTTEDYRTAGYTYVLDGLMLPGSVLAGTSLDQVYFTIDNNLYHLQKDQLKAALSGETLSDGTTPALTDDYKMRAGVHYIFTMTVGKKKMDNLTAAVVPWEEVTAAESTPSNARIVVSLLDNGTKKTGDADFDLFRKADISTTINDAFDSYLWTTGYAPAANKAQLVENTTEGEYTAQETSDPFTPWYWPDNKTFYHFRTVSPKTTETWKVTADATNGDFITIQGAEDYTDVCWGAPFFALGSGAKLSYDVTTRGFDGTGSGHQISRAIGATENKINIEMFHMMSDVTIQLTTTAGSDAVDLENAQVSLSNIYPKGIVRMGNGLVTPDETESKAPVVGTVTLDAVDSKYKWHYGFVPQTLDGGNDAVTTDDVVLTITTKDHNQYIVEMKDVVATTVENKLIAYTYTAVTGGYTINRWLPNYRYTYSFKLKKTGIATITATLASWEEVTAGDDNVVIK